MSDANKRPTEGRQSYVLVLELNENTSPFLAVLEKILAEAESSVTMYLMAINFEQRILLYRKFVTSEKADREDVFAELNAIQSELCASAKKETPQVEERKDVLEAYHWANTLFRMVASDFRRSCGLFFLTSKRWYLSEDAKTFAPCKDVSVFVPDAELKKSFDSCFGEEVITYAYDADVLNTKESTDPLCSLLATALDYARIYRTDNIPFDVSELHENFLRGVHVGVDAVQFFAKDCLGDFFDEISDEELDELAGILGEGGDHDGSSEALDGDDDDDDDDDYDEMDYQYLYEELYDRYEELQNKYDELSKRHENVVHELQEYRQKTSKAADSLTAPKRTGCAPDENGNLWYWEELPDEKEENQ